MDKRLSLYSILIISLSASICACDSLIKDPDYVGTWQFSEKITSNDIVFNTTRTLVLTRNSYEENYTVRRENSSMISEIIGTKGNLAMTHSNLIFELKELGTCQLDGSSNCTGNVAWFNDETQYWKDNVKYFEKTVMGVFEVVGTTLRLTRDLNDDGDYEDTGEDVTFELQ